MNSYNEKCRALEQKIKMYVEEDIIVAFSGGVDSSLLLKTACIYAKETGRKVYAVTVHTKLHSGTDLKIAKRIAEEMGAIHKVLEIDELSKAGIENNPPERCYLCKRYMFTQILEEAGKMGITRVLEGTNMDDTKEYRPGIRALHELGIISPLMLSGFTKKEVRRRAEEYEIEVADRPSMPCLATRFPYNTKISYEELRKVDEIEEEIRFLGFRNVRARIHDRLVRLEVDARDIIELVKWKEQIIPMIKQRGYWYVSVDLEGFRSGSQDVNLESEGAVE